MAAQVAGGVPGFVCPAALLKNGRKQLEFSGFSEEFFVVAVPIKCHCEPDRAKQSFLSSRLLRPPLLAFASKQQGSRKDTKKCRKTEETPREKRFFKCSSYDKITR